MLNAFDNFSAMDAFGLPIDVLFARISLLFPSASVNCPHFPSVASIVAFVASIVALVALGIV